jgi:cyanophycinase
MASFRIAAVTGLLTGADASKPYTYWCVGNCDHDASVVPSPGTILMGGGTDTDDAFKQHLKWSNGGDFLVLRSSGDDGYNSYIQGLGESNSVATLLTSSRDAAEDAFVLAKIDAAEAIFFAGGDQWTYLQQWQGTSMQRHLQAAIDRGVPVGGTSAGCDIQSGNIYTAENDSIQSDKALRDPFDVHMTLQERPFLRHPSDLLLHAIVDTHFVTRDRMGRLVAMLGRLWKDGERAFASGIDEQTAIAIDASGKGTVLMQGKDGGRAFVLSPTRAAERCEGGDSLDYRDVPVQKLDAYYGDVYDFVAMRGGDASQSYSISVKEGVLSDPYYPPSQMRAGRSRDSVFV